MAAVKPYGNVKPKVNGDRLQRTTDGTLGYALKNTRPLHSPDGGYSVKVAILMGDKRVNTNLPVQYGIADSGFSGTGQHTALTRESVKRFISLIPEGKRIIAFESKANAETEKGEYSQTEGSSSEAFADTFAMALYFRARQIYITIG